jgi:hypothetical protein
MDLQHTADVEYAEFSRLLREDTAFGDVQLLHSPRGILWSGKHVVWMRGTVASDADLNRLRSLAAEYHIPWNEEVEVTGSPANARPAPSRSSNSAKVFPE